MARSSFPATFVQRTDRTLLALSSLRAIMRWRRRDAMRCAGEASTCDCPSGHGDQRRAARKIFGTSPTSRTGASPGVTELAGCEVGSVSVGGSSGCWGSASIIGSGWSLALPA